MTEQYERITCATTAEFEQWVSRASLGIQNTPSIVIKNNVVYVSKCVLDSRQWIQSLTPVRQLKIILEVLKCMEHLVAVYGLFILNWKMVKINSEQKPMVWIHSNIKKHMREFPIIYSSIADIVFIQNLKQVINYIYEVPRELADLHSIIKYINQCSVWIGRAQISHGQQNIDSGFKSCHSSIRMDSNRKILQLSSSSTINKDQQKLSTSNSDHASNANSQEPFFPVQEFHQWSNVEKKKTKRIKTELSSIDTSTSKQTAKMPKVSSTKMQQSKCGLSNFSSKCAVDETEDTSTPSSVPPFMIKNRKESQKIDLIKYREFDVQHTFPHYSFSIRKQNKSNSCNKKSEEFQIDSLKARKPGFVNRFEESFINLGTNNEIIQELDQEVDQLFGEQLCDERHGKQSDVAQDFDNLFQSRLSSEQKDDASIYQAEFEDILQ